MKVYFPYITHDCERSHMNKLEQLAANRHCSENTWSNPLRSFELVACVMMTGITEPDKPRQKHVRSSGSCKYLEVKVTQLVLGITLKIKKCTTRVVFPRHKFPDCARGIQHLSAHLAPVYGSINSNPYRVVCFKLQKSGAQWIAPIPNLHCLN